MTSKNFIIFDTINRVGLENSEWGLCKDVEAEYHFGSYEDLYLDGKFVYIYNQDFVIIDEKFEKVEPDYVLTLSSLDNVYLYKL